MNPTIFFVGCLLVGLASAAPTSDDDKVIITKEFFPEELVKYTAEHEIVNMLLPLNSLNFDDNDDSSDTYLFFVEADTTDGKKDYKGLYILKNEVATKLLDNGKDFAATVDDSKTVYFATTDGIYEYKYETNKAEKYGTITDSLIGIAKYNGSDLIYVLTEDHVLYKVTEGGTKKEKVEEVVNAQQIILDYENNLYYYTPDKHIYVYNAGGVKKVEGLPTATYVNILKPAFVIENGVPVVLDHKGYIVYANGTNEFSNFEFVAKPTAYSMEGTIVQYYAYNKKIYEYNLLTLVLGQLLNELKEYLEDKKGTIESYSTKKGSVLRHEIATRG